MQVTAIEGLLEEVVPLLSVIPASPRPQNWLGMLEEKMRNTLVQCVAECVERRIRGRESPNKLLELINALGKRFFFQVCLTNVQLNQGLNNALSECEIISLKAN